MPRILDSLRNYYRKAGQRGESPLLSTGKLPQAVLARWSAQPPGPRYGMRLYDRPLLVAYARSGTNWIRYYLEFMTGRPTPGHERLVLDNGDYCIDRAHAGFEVLDRYGSAILVVRDFRECLVRHHSIEKIREYDSVEAFLEDARLNHSPTWYINNIAAFDAFEGDKLLLFYEDLLDRPVDSLGRIKDFLDLPDQKFVEFTADLDEHKKNSVQAYTRNQSSETQGASGSGSYHADRHLTEPEKEAFTRFYETRHPRLYREYLARYDAPRGD